ncbi:MAG: glycosyltransferase [Ardenticatenia bacterium]|nr:glycosyltransferase [Ardenticatenia bacterium]
MMAPAERSLLILFSDTGGGHRAAAEAVREAVGRVAPRWNVMLVDFIRSCALPPFNRIGALYRPVVDYTPWLWATGFHFTSWAPAVALVNRLIELVAAQGFVRLFEQTRPDLVLSVHPFATDAPARALAGTGVGTPFVVVVTDLLTVHPLWFTPRATLYMVPNDHVARLARRAGILPSRTRVTGLPVALSFSAPLPSQDELKARYGLPTDRPLVLLMGGGEGMGPLEAQAEAVARSGLPLSLMVVAGRNERLRRKLAKRTWPTPVHVSGFVRDVPHRMAAADVVITKAGPATLCEALTAGRPLLVSRFIPGQEAGNVRWVVDEGAAFYVPQPRDICTALRRLFHPDGTPTPAYYQMAANARRLTRPTAALEIAGALADLVPDAAAHPLMAGHPR